MQVHDCLKDTKELGISGPMASQIYDEIDGSERGFVELAAWQVMLCISDRLSLSHI